MSQIDSGFSESQKDSLSWALIAKLLVEIEESVVPTELFPSSFFAQSLELEPFNRESLVSIRRRANGVIAGSTELPDIFERIHQDAQEAASYILSESDISVTNEPSKQALAGAEIAKQFSKLLNQDSYKIEWGWADASDGMGGEFAPKEYLLQHFEIPSAWNAFAPPLKDTDWMAWLWFVMKHGQPHSVHNFQTGEVVLTKGKNSQSKA
jgi:hypothetical protein